jgi:hypothetical protein
LDALGTTPNSETKFLIQTSSFSASETAMHSAYAVESATMSCLKLFYLTAPPLRQNTKPDYDLESSVSV